jgi:hypothetical protein
VGKAKAEGKTKEVTEGALHFAHKCQPTSFSLNWRILTDLGASTAILAKCKVSVDKA